MNEIYFGQYGPGPNENGESMKIAIATKDDWKTVSGHAGKVHDWLLFELSPGKPLAAPKKIHLEKSQLPHEFKDDKPHPLMGVDLLVAASAGDGFIRHMTAWGGQVVLTGECDPVGAMEKIMQHKTLQDPRFDITTALCKLRDLFSTH